jgi:Flp pilus assembly protein TadB
MRWLMLVFLVSLVALLIAAGGLAHYIWREHKRRRAKPPAEKQDSETEERS